MRIYSNVLTAADLRQAAHDVPGLDIDEIEEIRFPRLRTRGWKIRTASTTSRRRRNTGTSGADQVNAASWDDHGRWFALLYQIDPDARVSTYNDADDFHRQTQRKFQQDRQLPADLELALQELLERCDRQDVIEDFREYLATGRINRELKRRLDEEPECRKAMDILFGAQLDTVRQVIQGLL